MAKTLKFYKKESEGNWGQITEENLSDDQIKIGAILRMADASEKIALNYSALIRERDRLETNLKDYKAILSLDRKRIAGLKGYIKRLRKLLDKE